jgi:hypothetical protein
METFLRSPLMFYHLFPLPIVEVRESWLRCSRFVAVVLGDGSLSPGASDLQIPIRIDDVTYFFWKID